MIRELDLEQTKIQQELERYNGWFYSINVQFIKAKDKLKLVRKKIMIAPENYFNKITKGEIFHESRFMS